MELSSVQLLGLGVVERRRREDSSSNANEDCDGGEEEEEAIGTDLSGYTDLAELRETDKISVFGVVMQTRAEASENPQDAARIRLLVLLMKVTILMCEYLYL